MTNEILVPFITNSFPVFVEDGAAQQLFFVAQEENVSPRLRISIEGGGCSGFKYQFNFDNAKGEDDLIAKFGKLEVVVDPISALYLQGATLTYTQDINGDRFEMRNPLAKSTCGCGSSFTT